MKKTKADFEGLVGRIQTTSEALQQDALVVINRSVTARAWLTGYYIVEYEQHVADRAKYDEGLLKRLAERLKNANFALPSLKNYRAFYKVYPEVGIEVAAYLQERFGKSYTACSLLADTPKLALPEKNYTVCRPSPVHRSREGGRRVHCPLRWRATVHFQVPTSASCKGGVHLVPEEGERGIASNC